MKKSNDLLLLAFSISTLNNKTKILDVLVEGLNNIFNKTIFRYSNTDSINNSETAIPLIANNLILGNIIVENFNELEQNDKSIIYNLINLTASTVLHLEKDEEISNRIYKLELEKDKKSLKLNNSIKELENSKLALLNLIEDLNDESEKRKKTETELRQSQLKYKTIADESPIGIFYFNKYGVITECNKKYVELIGSSRNEIIGFNLLKQLKNKKLIQEIKKTLSEGGGFYEGPYTSVTGGKSTYSRYILKGIYENDEIVAGLGLHEDISVRKQNELELAEQKEILENIIQGTNAGTWDWDIINDNIQLNQKWAEILGFKLNEVLPYNSKKWSSQLHPNDAEQVYKALNQHLAGKTEYYNVEFRMPHKSGHWVWINARGKVTQRDQNGKPLKMSGIHLDISKQKQNELKIQKQNEDLEALNEELNANLEEIKIVNKQLEIALEKSKEADRLKNAFLANMSHEIRTPMNGILGFSNLLSQTNLKKEKLIDYVQQIQKSGKRMLNTINDLMDISRIEAKMIKVNNSEFDLIELCKNQINFFKPEADKKQIDLYFELPDKYKSLFVYSDADKIEAIIINLIKNAIKYTPSGYVKLSLNYTGNEILISIIDSGIGIPKNRQQAIFDRFVQADIEDTQVFEGTGLGLSISKSYADMLDAEINLESEENVGSTFTLKLPLTAEVKEKQITKAIDLTDLKNKFSYKDLKILIVEDETISDQFLTIILKDYCSEILHAKNGYEAIEICKNNPEIDIIFMDIKMPKLGGYQATKQIRQFNKDVIIIAQTAYAMQGDREKAINAGCNDYITKPILPDELQLLLSKYFEK